MGWAKLDISDQQVELEISNSSLISVSGRGLLKVGGEIAEDGRVPILGRGVEVGWTAISIEALFASSGVARELSDLDYSFLFPGLSKWMEGRKEASVGVSVSDRTLDLGTTEEDRAGLVTVLLVLPEPAWRHFLEWMKPVPGVQTKASISFGHSGIPTPALRSRLGDGIAKFGMAYDSSLGTMAVFSDDPKTRISAGRAA
jgi:hypothetical protein